MRYPNHYGFSNNEVSGSESGQFSKLGSLMAPTTSTAPLKKEPHRDPNLAKK